MSIAIITEVWANAPADLTNGDLLILLRLADAASEDYRMSWESVNTLARYTRMSRRNVFNCLQRLEERGIIDVPSKDELPPGADLYRSTVRRIFLSDLWPQSEEIAPVEGGEEIAPQGELGDTQPLVPNRSTSYKPRRGTSYPHSVTRPRRVKKSQPEVDDDPQSHVLAELAEPSDEPDRSILSDSLQPRSRRRSVTPAAKLVGYFKDLSRVAEGTIPGETNDEALRGSFQRWMNEGHEASVIRAMIEAYWGGTFRRSTDVIAWKDFLARRDELVRTSTRKVKSEQTKITRDDPTAWAG